MIKIFKKAYLPAGFKAHGLACGIKRSGKLDLALFYSGVPAKACGVFTTNRIQAAPVKLSRLHLARSKSHRAIIVNSGNANCFTGKRGYAQSLATARAVAQYAKIKPAEVLVGSTGIIGKTLPFEKISRALPELIRGLPSGDIHDAARAIMTTDTCVKEATAEFTAGGKKIRITGVAKGAGMIAPDMATMLCFILTDANITQRALERCLAASVRSSFNCISVDGCMSTNDSVIALANGLSGNTMIGVKNMRPFELALRTVCLELAKMMVYDAEGATKFIRIRVTKARNFLEARKAALAIANSNLFKTAMYGKNPNFGRVVASVGASGVEVREDSLKVSLSPLGKREVSVEVSLSRGRSECTVYTCDLTPEYIKINAGYN